MYCYRCHEMLDFASNPIGDIKLEDGITKIYCKDCYEGIKNQPRIVKGFPGVRRRSPGLD